MFFFSRTKNEESEAARSAFAVGSSGSDESPAEVSKSLRVLGLSKDASWEDICTAHARLVADLTPGAGASHHNVALAEAFLQEVNEAFSSLQVIRSVA